MEGAVREDKNMQEVFTLETNIPERLGIKHL